MFRAFGIFLTFLICSKLFATEENFHLYIDADRSGTRESGLAIEMGVKAALAMHDNKIGGREVEVVLRNHRGNSNRSFKHIKEYEKDPQALAIVSGLHSPPLLAHRDYINKNGILMLVPWAAATPITRGLSEENWIFRLSIDDSKAGEIIVKHAINRQQRKKPALLLEKTGWGKANDKTMREALARRGIEPTVVQWFNWNIGDEAARIVLRKIIQTEADCILLVANAPEGKVIARAMVSLPESQRIPIYSHWGITGGDFAKVIDNDIRKELTLHFIQTRFNSLYDPKHILAKEALQNAHTLFPEHDVLNRGIDAATGFVHAFDLTRLLIRAAQQTPLSLNIKEVRAAMRNQLENLQTEMHGIVKTYRQPFEPYTAANPDAHEALGIEDYVMGYYNDENKIIILP